MRSHVAKSVFWVGILVCCTVFPVVAQDIDSIVTSSSRRVPTIAEEIKDPAERAAFLQLYQTHDPQTIHILASAFLQKYPQSAFLETVYELAARSSFDLGDYVAGLQYAQQSLTLLPENPLLLVAVADVEARNHQLDAAAIDAQKALDYFDRFARPIAISEQDWPNIQQTQRATAWFVIGRVQTLRALEKPAGPEQKSLLNQATSSLLRAQSLHPTDSEILYLLGVVHVATQQLSQATADFGAVYKLGGDLAPRAREQLMTIYNAQNQKAHRSVAESGFDIFLKTAESEPVIVAPQQESTLSTFATHQPGYAGSASCKSCHTDIYNQWAQTGMSKMLRPYAPQNVVGDFVKNNEFYAGDDITFRYGKLQITPSPNRKLFARMVLKGGRHYFEIKQSDGQWHTYPVDYTIGSKWQQTYATKLPNGEIHVFPIQYSVIHKQWLNYWKVIDNAGTERSNPYNWEKLDNATNYQTNCAVCHTSQLRNVNSQTPGATGDSIVFREGGINCEMCHGPSANHVAAMKKGEIYKKAPIAPPVAFDQISSRNFVKICGQCHMQSNIHAASSHGEVNYSSTGNFFLTNLSVPYDEFSRKAFYKDGRFSQTTFIVESMERSQCFLKGNVTCGTCHDPHGHGPASNPTSLKFRDDSDKMCTGCHVQFQNTSAIASHTHHAVNSEASRCVSCHMPRIMDGLLIRARSHQIDDIPNAEMTMKFGQDESPNACLLCHKQQTSQWVQSSLLAWKNNTVAPSISASADNRMKSGQ